MKHNRLHILKKIKPYLLKSKLPAILLVIISIISIPTTMISPKLFQILIDDVMRNEELSKIVFVIVGLILVFVLRFIIDGLNLYCDNKMINLFTLNLRKTLLGKYLKIPYAKFEKYDVGDVKMRIDEDVNSLGSFIKSQVVDYFYNILLLIVCFTISLSINVYMTIICISAIPFVLAINKIIGQSVRKVNEEIREVSEEYYNFEQGTFSMWREIKYNNLEDDFSGMFGNFRKTLAKLGMKSIRLWGISEVFGDFKTNYLTTIFIYIVGGFFALQGRISVGTLIMFSQYYAILFAAIDTVNSKKIELKTSEPFYNRIFEILDEPEENPKEIIASIDNIKIENLTFGYDLNEKSYVLENFNLSLKCGESIAITGKSCCGKTTLAKLLLGLYELNEGEILFNDINLEIIQKESLYDLIGVVMQDPYLFNMTIRENLQIANKTASLDDMITACKKADIYEFIESLPNKFDTIIGERGVKLSGGQKQRLSIARALLKKPQLLLLDEATSSVDIESENRINDAINNENMTKIIISHKPSVLKNANKVISINIH